MSSIHNRNEQMKEYPFKNKDIIKNYQEMCRLLEEKKCGGNAKIGQMKKWSHNFSWDREGDSFIITLIKSPYFVSSKDLNRIVKPYHDELFDLILHLVSERLVSGKNPVKIEEQHLMEYLCLCNNYYFHYFNHQELHPESLLDIEEEVVREFYERSYSMINRDLKEVIKLLEELKIIKVTVEKQRGNNKHKSLYTLEFTQEFIEKLGEDTAKKLMLSNRDLLKKGRLVSKSVYEQFNKNTKSLSYKREEENIEEREIKND